MHRIVVSCQSSSDSVGYKCLLKLCVYKCTVLSSDGICIPHYKHSGQLITQLNPVSAKCLEIIRDGMDRRFFSRYYEEHSRIYDMQCFLNPAFKDLDHVKKVVATDFQMWRQTAGAAVEK
jgi:hypothetical protein